MADLLDRTPGLAVGGDCAHEDLRPIVLVEVAPYQVNRVVLADGEIIVEHFRRSVCLHQPPRREAFAVVFGYAVVNARLLFRAAESEPTDMKPAAAIAPNARTRVRTRGNLPAVVADFHGRAKGGAAVGRFAQDVIANLLVVDLAVDHINSFAAVCESNSQLAAFTQSFAHRVVFRQRFAVGTDSKR